MKIDLKLLKEISKEGMSKLYGGETAFKHINNGQTCNDINNGTHCDVINNDKHCSVINNKSNCSEINNWKSCD